MINEFRYEDNWVSYRYYGKGTKEFSYGNIYVGEFLTKNNMDMEHTHGKTVLYMSEIGLSESDLVKVSTLMQTVICKRAAGKMIDLLVRMTQLIVVLNLVRVRLT